MKCLSVPLFACFLIACATASNPGDGDGDGDGIDASVGIDGSLESCSKDPCDIYDQCGCEAPQVCDLDFTTLDGATSCRDVTSPGTELSACGTFDSEACAGGYICLGGGTSQCRRYCEVDADCSGLGSCLLMPSSGGNPIPGVAACTKSCDPISTNPSTCPSGFGCGVATINNVSVTDCRAANPAGTEEVNCDQDNGGVLCAPGFTCVAISVGGVPDRTVCKQTCTYPGGACTDGAQACNQLGSGGPQVNGVEYGACL